MCVVKWHYALVITVKLFLTLEVVLQTYNCFIFALLFI